MKLRNQSILILMGALGMSAGVARADALVTTDSKLKVAPVVPLKLQAFSLKEVRLLAGDEKEMKRGDH